MELAGAVIGWLTDPAHWSGPGGIAARLAEHVALSSVSLLIATLLAIPAGLWVGHTRRHAGLVVNAANVVRAIPSLAIIGITIPLTTLIDPQVGFFVLPVVIAMIALALPPIVVNACTGVAEVDRDMTEAARGMGMRERQVLGRVELPLAMPVIVAGVGSAAVQIVATMTLGALFGAGGLGRYLVEGLAQNDDAMVFGGVVLVAGLALATEGGFALVGRAVAPAGRTRQADLAAGLRVGSGAAEGI